MGFFCRHVFRPMVESSSRISNMYNKNGGAWAVVTGGTDGIGLGICHNLAEQGFNVCIISRN